MRNLAVLAFQTVSEFTLKYRLPRREAAAKSRYFVGICAEPDAAGAGGAGTAALVLAGAVVAGICAAPEAAPAGAVTAAPSSTLEVLRDRKLALPLAPNRLPEPPLPNAAPMSAPFPCCTRIRPIMPSAESICTARTMVNTTFISTPKLIARYACQLWAA